MTGTWALNLFDRLHVGHHVLIDRLQEMTEPVLAVTNGELLSHELEFGQLVQPIALRVKNLKKYLRTCELDDLMQVTIIDKYSQLLDIPGPTTFVMFAGPCCTEIDEKGLEQRRRRFGDIDKIEYLKPVRADDGDKVSSARIRKGEIDRMGRRLKGTTEPPRRLELNSRAALKTPKGDLFDIKNGTPEKEVVKRIERERPELVIAVGDMTSFTIMNAGYTPHVCIVDGATERGPFEKTVKGTREYTIYNPAATIYPEAWATISTALDGKQASVIFVEGEEDLLGFPAVLLAPEGAVMLYGQPRRGIVWVPVNEENKRLARELLEQMPVIT